MHSWLSTGLLSVLAFANPPAPPVTVPSSSVKPASAAHYVLLNAADRRVRVTDARLGSLMAEGLDRSETFGALVAALNRTDVIVYIESVMVLPKNTMGRLTMLPTTGNYRYLRVQIRSELSRREAIALIGHELQHALEIADAAEVRDTSTLIRLYQRIGHASTGEHAYDTQAAQDTGRTVRRELAS